MTRPTDSRPRPRLAVLALSTALAGCAAYHTPSLTSEPPGARIYAGGEPDGLRPMHHVTPRPSQWTPFPRRCYRVVKAGYARSDVVCVDTRERRTVHFELTPRPRLVSGSRAAPHGSGDVNGEVEVQVVSRRIFDLVSLGEPVGETLARLGRPDRNLGNELVWAGRGPGAALGVTSWNSRVAAVAALYEPSTWATLRRVEALLRARYGEPVAEDELPPEAASDAARRRAIETGRGRVVRTWQTERYDVQLAWERPGIVLRYHLPALWARMQRARLEGY